MSTSKSILECIATIIKASTAICITIHYSKSIKCSCIVEIAGNYNMIAIITIVTENFKVAA
jgi:hypothetical protein